MNLKTIMQSEKKKLDIRGHNRMPKQKGEKKSSKEQAYIVKHFPIVVSAELSACGEYFPNLKTAIPCTTSKLCLSNCSCASDPGRGCCQGAFFLEEEDGKQTGL